MDNECIICLEELDDDIVVLSCPHSGMYHYTCLKQWINSQNLTNKICTICDNDVEILNIINEPIEHRPFKINNGFFSCCSIL